MANQYSPGTPIERRITRMAHAILNVTNDTLRLHASLQTLQKEMKGMSEELVTFTNLIEEDLHQCVQQMSTNPPDTQES